MKKILPLFMLVIGITNHVSAQVIQLSNNTNLLLGVPISSTKAIFIQQETDSLWVTDGTAANTFKLNIPVKLESETGFAIWNNKLYFSGINAANGAELWVTDGTVAGTSMVIDINGGAASSSPRAMIVFNNALYFFASTPLKGAELWKSDGTHDGTALLRDINDGIPGSYSDDISYGFFNNELYFSAVQNNGLELWKTNGTTNGTALIKDINVGPNSSRPEFLEVFNNALFFTANNGTNGRELWKTTGTENGTEMVKDIFPGSDSANIHGVMTFKGKMLFNARNAIGNEELYSSDGTLGGTNVLKEINAGAAGSDPDVTGGVIINNKLIFAATSAATGRELFVTDGTEGGTALFKDIVVGAAGTSPFILLDRNLFSNVLNQNPNTINEALYNGKIFFTTTSAAFSQQLWITDGTSNNTVLVKDFGIYGLGFFTSYFYTQSGLYLAANDAAKGVEIIKSQGTGATTTLYADVNIGQPSSVPFFQFFILNGKVFFSADDGDSGESEDRDLFVLSGNETPLPLQLLKFAAAETANGVNLDWTTLNEHNTSNFELQRSIDGKDFSGITNIKAAGKNTTKKSYTYFDKDAYKQKSTTLYYRLKMVDEDGKFTYSPIALVRLGLPVVKGVQVSPNPASKYLRINISAAAEQDAQIRIINNNGQVVKSISTRLSSGNNQQIVGLENMAPGIYHAEVIIAGKSESTRFVKE